MFVEVIFLTFRQENLRCFWDGVSCITTHSKFALLTQWAEWKRDNIVNFNSFYFSSLRKPQNVSENFSKKDKKKLPEETFRRKMPSNLSSYVPTKILTLALKNYHFKFKVFLTPPAPHRCTSFQKSLLKNYGPQGFAIHQF